ncbi:hypothetical protein BKN37_22600 [Mycobacterium talmoniae]|uniref:PknH-like extracellular domain-containing protein n=1 Tax=Mycobacterium talmoniae TaxID=1858794 RepID=A0A1S1NBX2_9MYCO|nr:hypothetical protein BKN37_22600 [Mycobacterium talmoniae]
MAESHGDTTTTPPARQSVTASEIESLPVPFDDVKAMAGDELQHSNITREPTDYAAMSPTSPCFLPDSGTADVAVFGHEPLAFRNVMYTGFSNVFAEQALAVYASESVAKDKFTRFVQGLHTCAASHPAGMDTPSSTVNTATWQRHLSGVNLDPATDMCAEGVKQVQNVMFRVTSCRLDNDAAIAAMMTDRITEKINNPV